MRAAAKGHAGVDCHFHYAVGDRLRQVPEVVDDAAVADHNGFEALRLPGRVPVLVLCLLQLVVHRHAGHGEGGEQFVEEGAVEQVVLDITHEGVARCLETLKSGIAAKPRHQVEGCLFHLREQLFAAQPEGC